MSCKSRFTLGWLAVLLSASVAAQTTTAQAPTESRTGAATTAYRSVFDQYVPANDDKPLVWRDANALVGSIGGWRVYAREAQQSAPAGTTQPSAPSGTGPQTAPANATRPAAAGSATPHQKH